MSESIGRSDLGIEFFNVGAREGPLLTIKSGSVSSGGEIAKKLRDAAFKATFNGLIEAFRDFEPTVAKDTGAMRNALRLAVANSINGQRGNSTIVFNMDTVTNIASRVVEYTRYHYETGPQGQSQYRDPTTSGTEPFKASKFIAIARTKIIANLHRELQAAGLQVR